MNLEIRNRFGLRTINAGRRKSVANQVEALLLFAQFTNQWDHLRGSVALALKKQAEAAKSPSKKSPRFDPYLNNALKKFDVEVKKLRTLIERNLLANRWNQ